MELDQVIADNSAWQKEDVQQRLVDPFGPTSAIQGHEMVKAAKEKEYDTSVLGDAFRVGNIGNGLFNMVERKLTFKQDPNFRLRDHFDELTNGLSTEYWGEFSGARSLDEANDIRAQIDRELEAQSHLASAGIVGGAALLGAGVLDVDLPFMFLSGGESTMAKLGLQGTKLAKWFEKGAKARKVMGAVSAGAARGAAEGLAYAAADTALHPTSSLAYLPKMVLTNTLFGGGIMGLSKTASKANASIRRTMDDFEEALHDEFNMAYNAPRFDNVAPEEFLDTMFSPATAREFESAAQAPRKTVSVAGEFEQAIHATRETAENVTEVGVFTATRDKIGEAASRLVSSLPDNFANSPIAKRLYDVLSNSPIATDLDRLWRSGSDVAKATAYTFFESAAGVVRNNRSAAALKNMYESRISGAVIPQHVEAYLEWAGARKATIMDIHWQDKLKQEFDRLVIDELMHRRFNGVGDPMAHPAVRKAADAADNASAVGLRVAKGNEGELSVAGFETLKQTTGYVPLVWHGKKIMQAIAQFGKKRVTDLIMEGYRKALPGVEEETLRVLANAILRRARGKAKDMDMSLTNMLTADGRGYLREALMDNGMSAERAEAVVKGLGGTIEERGVSGYAKRRTEIDLRTADGDLSLYDLIETDHLRLWSKYSRDISGRGALARKGISNRAQLSDLFDKILEEDGDAGGKLTRKELEDMFSHFDAGPLSGGVSPTVRRLIQTTNLSLLGQLGLTQMAETGAQIAAVGIENWMRHAPLMNRIVKSARSGHTDDLLAEFEVLTGKIGDEHNQFRDDLAMDYARNDIHAQNQILATLDKALAKGQRLQGFLSGFNSIRKAQQRIAVSAMTDKVMKQLRAGDFVKGARRLTDMGLDEKTLRNFKRKYVDSGIVEFDSRGLTQRLNLDQWSIKDAEDFTLAINRFTNQTVQRAMAGETTSWMHRDVGKLLTHLQQFPILAMQKQVLRNARIMDTASAMTFMYGLGTAGLAYTAKQAINGRTDGLDAEGIAKGAFGLSNMTGWIPMWTDPVAAMLGMDDLRFNHYGPRVGAPILQTPVVPTMQKLAALPGALMPDGDFSRSDAAAVKTIPILGRAYGFSAMFDAMAND